MRRERKSDFFDISPSAEAPRDCREKVAYLFPEERGGSSGRYQQRSNDLGDQTSRIGVNVGVRRSRDEHKAQTAQYKC